MTPENAPSTHSGEQGVRSPDLKNAISVHVASGNDPLLRSEKFTDEQRRYAVERGLAGPEVLPEEERDG